MNDTIKSVVSVASLPRPTPPPVVHRHLQIDLRLGVWRFFYFPFLFRACGVFVWVGFFLVFSSFFFFFLLFSSFFFFILRFSLTSRTRVHSILITARDNILPHV